MPWHEYLLAYFAAGLALSFAGACCRHSLVGWRWELAAVLAWPLALLSAFWESEPR